VIYSFTLMNLFNKSKRISRLSGPKGLVISFVLTVNLLCFHVQAQEGMHVQEFNFTTLTPIQTPEITNELLALTPVAVHQHPEFGILPFNRQCDSCIELVDRRTANSRYYVKKGSGGNSFFIQQCYGNLHYADSQGNWLTIDPRLKPDPSGPGLYRASHQPVPAALNLTTGSTTLQLAPFELAFNGNEQLIQVQGNMETSLPLPISMTHTTVGDDGSYSTNYWQGIDRSTIFGQGEIETNFILHAVPSLPSNQGWLAFEDKINLPPGYVLVRDNQGTQTSEGYWTGALKIVNSSTGQELVRWAAPVAFDSTQILPTSPVIAYQVKNTGTTYLIRTMVQVAWLLSPGTAYPVTIDPAVSANNTWSAGKIGFSSYAPGDGFCGNSSNWCLGGPLNVTFPGGATITNVVWGLTYHANIGAALSTGGFRMVGPCGEDPILPASMNNWYSCASPFSGNCVATGFSAPWLATCLTPSCLATVIPFNLKNIDCSGLSGACSTTFYFTTNNTWTITVSGNTLESLGNTATGNGTQTVTGSCFANSTLDPTAANGVPAYTYSWSPGGQTTPTIVVSSGVNCAPCGTYTCTVTDACGTARTAVFTFNVADCVLPVEMLSFDAVYNGQAVDVGWVTATETNDDYFTVERATDAQNFVSIGTVPTQAPGGNSSNPISYLLTDKNVKEGVYYYRLKQTDRNGHFTYMHTIPVTILSEKASFSIAPNPAKDNVAVNYFSYDGNTSILKIFGADGHLAVSRELENNRGSNTAVVDLSTLNNGLYLVTLVTGTQTYSVKLVKQ
jgi:hypothetical protein